jgi:hypothetical protein
LNDREAIKLHGFFINIKRMKKAHTSYQLLWATVYEKHFLYIFYRIISFAIQFFYPIPMPADYSAVTYPKYLLVVLPAQYPPSHPLRSWYIFVLECLH